MDPYMVFTFGTSKGKKHNLRVPHVGSANSYSDIMVRDIMNLVKNNSPFDAVKIGRLTSLVKAERIEVTESAYNIL